MQLVHRRPAVIYCVILSMLYKFVMADGLKSFQVKWCQFFKKSIWIYLNLTWYYQNFWNFIFIGGTKFFFLTSIVNLGSNARQDSRVLVLQPTASNSFFFSPIRGWTGLRSWHDRVGEASRSSSHELSGSAATRRRRWHSRRRQPQRRRR